MATKHAKKPCKQCKKFWQPKNAWTAEVGKFCSTKCRMAYHADCRQLGANLKDEE